MSGSGSVCNERIIYTKCGAGYAWDAYLSKCVKQKTKSPRAIKVNWPQKSDTTPRAQMLLTIQSILKTLHKKSLDVSKEWGIYHNPVEYGGNGLCFVIRNTGNIQEKVKSYTEVWRRGSILNSNIAGISLKQKANINYYFSIPYRYGGICPLVETALDLEPGGGAFAAYRKIRGCLTTIVFSMYPILQWQITPGQTIMDKRFGVFLHELSHVGCNVNSCSSLVKGHGGEQLTIDNAIRDISAKLGLKPRPIQ